MKAAFLLLTALSIACAKPVKILPLGDSITKGGGCESPVSYRKFLAEFFNANAIEFDFVGTRSCADDFGYDTDHQGMAGWTSENILLGRSEDTNTVLKDWIKGLSADIVLIHLGTNDIGQNHTYDRILRNLTGIVGVLRQDNPGVQIYIARILPMNDKWKLGERIPRLNDSIAALSERLELALVDMHSGFNPAVDMYDGVHPNEGGYRKMAERWFATLRPKLHLAGIRRRIGAGSRKDKQQWLATGRPAGSLSASPGLTKR